MAHEVELTGVPLGPLQRNIFDLVPEFQNQFDYVIEHTCFCAIDPSLRPNYVELAAQLLQPQGGVAGGIFLPIAGGEDRPTELLPRKFGLYLSLILLWNL